MSLVRESLDLGAIEGSYTARTPRLWRLRPLRAVSLGSIVIPIIGAPIVLKLIDRTVGESIQTIALQSCDQISEKRRNLLIGQPSADPPRGKLVSPVSGSAIMFVFLREKLRVLSTTASPALGRPARCGQPERSQTHLRRSSNSRSVRQHAALHFQPVDLALAVRTAILFCRQVHHQPDHTPGRIPVSNQNLQQAPALTQGIDPPSELEAAR